MRRRLTPIQKTVLENLAEHSQRGVRAYVPRSSLERLQKKGMCEGNKKNGWAITSYGLGWLQDSKK